MKDYSLRLKAQLADLRRLISAVCRDPDREQRIELHALAHRIHGTAGVMGFQRESRLARAVERATDPKVPADLEALREAATGFDWDRRPEPESTLLRGAQVQDAGRQPLGASSPQIMKVLLIEDDADFVAELDQVGRRAMVQVIGASGADEALELVRKHRFVGVIVDYYLDERLGVDVALELREHADFQGIPFAFVSVNASLATRMACAHAGGMFFLEKPIGDAAFNSVLQRFAAVAGRFRSRILLLDDDPDLCAHVQGWLDDEGWSTAIETDSRRLLDTCDAFRPDLVILDFNMPHVSGLECCRLLRTSLRWANLPLIFLTSAIDAETQAACFEAGADDFVDKPIIRPKLVARVRNRLERQALLKREAERDPLTGVFNRSAFVQRFDVRLAEARRNGTPMTLCLLDMDNFKRINSRYGHLAGDDVLRTFGQKLRARFRLEDLRCRWGGEEFVILLVGDTATQACNIVDRFLKEFSNLSFATDAGDFSVSFSGGVAQYPRDGESLRQLMAEADCQLHAAKAAGKNRIVEGAEQREAPGAPPGGDLLILAADPERLRAGMPGGDQLWLASDLASVRDGVSRQPPRHVLVDEGLPGIEALRRELALLAPAAEVMTYADGRVDIRAVLGQLRVSVHQERALTQAQAEAAERAMTQHALLARLCEGFLAIRADGTIQTADDQARALIRAPVLAGRRFADLLADEAPDLANLADLSADSTTALRLKPDGRELEVRVVRSLVADRRGFLLLLLPPSDAREA